MHVEIYRVVCEYDAGGMSESQKKRSTSVIFKRKLRITPLIPLIENLIDEMIALLLSAKFKGRLVILLHFSLIS